VKVRYVEGLAIHSGPESCAVTREGDGEALTGVRTGQPLSRERKSIPSADVVSCAEGKTARRVMRAPHRLGVVIEPGMCGRSLRGNREISGSTTRIVNGVVRIGKAKSRSR
jgi:RNA-directed DNA polymerase